MMSIDDLERELRRCSDIEDVEEVLEEIESAMDSIDNQDKDAEEYVDEILDTSYEPVSILGYEYTQSEILKKLDPTAYREIYLDMVDEIYSELEELKEKCKEKKKEFI